VLDRLDNLRAKHDHVLDGLIMDVLQVLSRYLYSCEAFFFPTLLITKYPSADMEVRRKAIGIVLSMTSTRNVEEVVLFLKKQLQKTQEADFDKVTRNAAVILVDFLITSLVGTRIPTTLDPVDPRHSC